MSQSTELSDPLTAEGGRRGRLFDIALLSACWCFLVSGSTLVTTCGALSVKNLGATTSVASMTVGLFLLGTAVGPHGSWRGRGRHLGLALRDWRGGDWFYV